MSSTLEILTIPTFRQHCNSGSFNKPILHDTDTVKTLRIIGTLRGVGGGGVGGLNAYNKDLIRPIGLFKEV